MPAKRDERITGIFDDACKQVISYFATKRRLTSGRTPSPEEFSDHFAVTLAELASSRLGSSWSDVFQIVSRRVISGCIVPID